MHKANLTADLRLDDLDMFCEDRHEGLYETMHGNVLSQEQWNERCDRLEANTTSESWPALKLALVVEKGGIDAQKAGESALKRLRNVSQTLLTGNSSGMRLANARLRDQQLSRPLPEGAVIRLCMCGRFVRPQ